MAAEIDTSEKFHYPYVSIVGGSKRAAASKIWFHL